MQINKYSIHENIERVDYDYNVGDKLIVNNEAAYKYETPYNGPSEISKYWANGMVTLKLGATKVIYNTHYI